MNKSKKNSLADRLKKVFFHADGKSLNRERLVKAGSVLACVVAFTTTYALILPAVTLEGTPRCGQEEHVHTEACYAYVDSNGMIVDPAEAASQLVSGDYSTDMNDADPDVTASPEMVDADINSAVVSTDDIQTNEFDNVSTESVDDSATGSEIDTEGDPLISKGQEAEVVRVKDPTEEDEEDTETVPVDDPVEEDTETSSNNDTGELTTDEIQTNEIENVDAESMDEPVTESVSDDEEDPSADPSIREGQDSEAIPVGDPTVEDTETVTAESASEDTQPVRRVLICGKEDHQHSVECFPENSEASSSSFIRNLSPKSIVNEIFGYGHSQTVTVDGTTITAEYDEGVLPDDVTMQATPVSADAYVGAVADAVGKDNTEIKTFDITFLSGEQEIEPSGEVKITFRADFIDPDTDPAVVHITDDGSADLMDTKITDDTITLKTDSFSVYAISYTVDFHWEVDGKEYVYSILGGQSISVSELAAALNIISEEQEATFNSNIENVTFSNKTDVKIFHVSENTTVGTLEKINVLDVQYSALFSDEQIETMKRKAYVEGDWVLISLQPFTTNEVLTITMKNGDIWTVVVTDDQAVNDPLGLHGKKYAIVNTKNGRNSALTTTSNGNNLSSLNVTKSGNSVSDSAAEWTFEYVKTDGEKNLYLVHYGQYYLKIEDGKITVTDRETALENLISIKKNGEKYRLTNEAETKALNNYGNNGFGPWNGNNNDEWMSFCTADIKNAAAHKPDNMVTTTDTRSTGFRINLFDYGPDSLDDVGNTFKSPDNSGINAGHELKFYSYGTDGSGKNNFTGGATAHQGIVKSTLGTDNYPMVNSSGGESLSYLFDETADGENKKVYSDVNYLFYKDSDGYYRYNSNKSYAYYDPSQGSGGDFKVYDGTYQEEGADNKFFAIGLFPFNDYDERYRCIHGDNFRWGCTGTRNTHGVYDEVGHYNHHFGISMDGSFVMPEDKKVNGKHMVYEFSGDDDMWVFIDGVLVLDIGGIHNPVSGKIDFTTGEVTVSDARATADGYDKKVALGAKSTIQDAFKRADKNWDESVNSKHEIRIFYMERGGMYSNCEITFNIPTVTLADIEFDKTDGKDTIEGATFALYLDPECTKPVTDKGIAITTSSKGNGHPNVTIKDIPVGITYYMREEKAPAGKLKDNRVYVVEAPSSLEDPKIYVYGDDNKKPVTEIVNIGEHFGDISFVKVDEENTEKGLKDATFALFTDPDCKKPYKVNESDASGLTATSDSNGNIKFSHLPANNTYYFKETKEPKDYIPSTEIFRAEIDATGKIVKIFREDGIEISGDTKQITNKQKGERTTVTVEKEWSDGNRNHSEDTVTVELYRVIEAAKPVSYTVNVNWKDNDAPSASDNAVIKADIINNETLQKVQTVSLISPSWSVEVDNLPSEDDDGSAITYSLVLDGEVTDPIIKAEIPASNGTTTDANGNYTTTINAISAGKVNITVQTDWGTGSAPTDDDSSISYIIYKNNDENSVVKDSALKHSNSWQETVSNLPARDEAGNAITYYVMTKGLSGQVTSAAISSGSPVSTGSGNRNVNISASTGGGNSEGTANLKVILQDLNITNENDWKIELGSCQYYADNGSYDPQAVNNQYWYTDNNKTYVFNKDNDKKDYTFQNLLKKGNNNENQEKTYYYGFNVQVSGIKSNNEDGKVYVYSNVKLKKPSNGSLVSGGSQIIIPATLDDIELIFTSKPITDSKYNPLSVGLKQEFDFMSDVLSEGSRRALNAGKKEAISTASTFTIPADAKAVEDSELASETGRFAKTGQPARVTLNQDGNGWSYTWTGLAKEIEIGGKTRKVTYYVKEVGYSIADMPEGTSVDTSYVNPEYNEDGSLKKITALNTVVKPISLEVTKEWYKANGSTPHIPSESEKTINFDVYQVLDGQTPGEKMDDKSGTVTYDSDKGVWNTVTISNLPAKVKDNDGVIHDATYYVKETSTGGYVASYRIKTGQEEHRYDDASQAPVGTDGTVTTIINTDGDRKVTVTKKWCFKEGNDEREATEPPQKEIYFKLICAQDDSLYKKTPSDTGIYKLTWTSENGWSTEVFDQLDVSKNYYIQEVDAAGNQISSGNEKYTEISYKDPDGGDVSKDQPFSGGSVGVYTIKNVQRATSLYVEKQWYGIDSDNITGGKPIWFSLRRVQTDENMNDIVSGTDEEVMRFSMSNASGWIRRIDDLEVAPAYQNADPSQRTVYRYYVKELGFKINPDLTGSADTVENYQNVSNMFIYYQAKGSGTNQTEYKELTQAIPHAKNDPSNNEFKNDVNKIKTNANNYDGTGTLGIFNSATKFLEQQLQIHKKWFALNDAGNKWDDITSVQDDKLKDYRIELQLKQVAKFKIAGQDCEVTIDYGTKAILGKNEVYRNSDAYEITPVSDWSYKIAESRYLPDTSTKVEQLPLEGPFAYTPPGSSSEQIVLAKFTYYVSEMKVYDGNNRDVTSEWTPATQIVGNEFEVYNRETSDLTLHKQWKDVSQHFINTNVQGLYFTVHCKSGENAAEDITEQIYRHPDAYGLSSNDVEEISYKDSGNGNTVTKYAVKISPNQEGGGASTWENALLKIQYLDAYVRNYVGSSSSKDTEMEEWAKLSYSAAEVAYLDGSGVIHDIAELDGDGTGYPKYAVKASSNGQWPDAGDACSTVELGKPGEANILAVNTAKGLIKIHKKWQNPEGRDIESWGSSATFKLQQIRKLESDESKVLDPVDYKIQDVLQTYTVQANTEWETIAKNLPLQVKVRDDQNNQDLIYNCYYKAIEIDPATNEEVLTAKYENNDGTDSDISRIEVININLTPVDILLQKTDTSDTPAYLPGAVFKLTKKQSGSYDKFEFIAVDNSTNPPGTIELDPEKEGEFIVTDGQKGVTIKALTTGVYKLEEVSPPSGYNKLLSPIEFEITNDGKIITPGASSSSGLPTSNTNTFVFTDTSSGSAHSTSVAVKNTPGAELPSTGGAGTGWFYGAGGVLALLAGSGLIWMRRRRSAVKQG